MQSWLPELFVSSILAPSRTISSTTSKLSHFAAKCRAVLPSWTEAAVTSDHWSSNSFTASRWPLEAAKCKGVCPSSSVTATSAPWSSNRCAVRTLPIAAALCRTVCPLISVRSVSAVVSPNYSCNISKFCSPSPNAALCFHFCSWLRYWSHFPTKIV